MKSRSKKRLKETRLERINLCLGGSEADVLENIVAEKSKRAGQGEQNTVTHQIGVRPESGWE